MENRIIQDLRSSAPAISEIRITHNFRITEKYPGVRAGLHSFSPSDSPRGNYFSPSVNQPYRVHVPTYRFCSNKVARPLILRGLRAFLGAKERLKIDALLGPVPTFYPLVLPKIDVQYPSATTVHYLG